MKAQKANQQQTADEERRAREAALDQTIECSFPASDPPSTNPNPYDFRLLEGRPPDPRR